MSCFSFLAVFVDLHLLLISLLINCNDFLVFESSSLTCAPCKYFIHYSELSRRLETLVDIYKFSDFKNDVKSHYSLKPLPAARLKLDPT